MNLVLPPRVRRCAVDRRARLSLAAIRRDVLRRRNAQDEFTLTGTPAPARDPTLFKVYGQGDNLLVAVAVFESVGPTSRHHPAAAANRNTIEIFFAPWHDGLGWFQFCFHPDGSVQTCHHLPYPEAHSTAFEFLRVNRHRWEPAPAHEPHRLYWLFAWFDRRAVFRRGPACGFNVVRQCPPIEEVSSWNHAAAVVVQDATTFGELCWGTPHGPAPRPVVLRRPTARQARAFRFSVTYDIPDNIAYSNPYDPDRLHRELAAWKSWGIDRVYWIEYGAISAWPSFWRTMIGSRNVGGDWVGRTRRACDDLLPCVARACRRLGLECWAVYKPFDLGFNTEYAPRDGRSTVREFENRWAIVHPDVAAHPECTMQADPAWSRPVRLPITRLSLYSERPFGQVAARAVTLWASTDNRRWRRYRRPLRVRSGAVRRPHLRWTPAGPVAEPGRARTWRLELSELAITAPFVALTIRGKTLPIAHRRFAFAEARDADGRAAPVSLATSGNRARGFQFDKTWLGWANHTEPVLDTFTWDSGDLGLAFAEPDRVPTLLEPTHPGAHRIWLGHLRRILAAGVDGIDVRTIGHHNCVASYLRLAFAPSVRDGFRRRYGRDAEPTPADYERVRRLRGAAYTAFLAQASTLVRRAGKQLGAHIEAGVEVPPRFDTRLQLQMLVDWRRWLRDRIVDEVSLRGWQAHNPYVHREILPLARQVNVPVHIISKNLPAGIDLRAVELCERFVVEACAAGFGGYDLYEADSLLRLNTAGIPMSVGNTEQAVRRAATVLRQWRGSA